MSSPHITISDKLCIFCQQRPEPGEKVATVLNCPASKGYTSAFAMPSIGQANIKYQDVYIDTEKWQWQLCLRPGCDRCFSSPRSILYHCDCYGAFRVLWKRSNMELLPSSLTAIYKIGSSLTPWFPPAEKPRIYCNNPGAHKWWSCGLNEMSALSARPTELSGFVASLSALPLELLGLILVAGGSEVYHTALLRHVLVAQVARVVSQQTQRSQNLQGDCAQACEPVVELLGNEYAVLEKDVGAAKQFGVDHLGVRSTSHNCPWYLEKKDKEDKVDFELFYEYPFLRPSLDQRLELWDVLKRPEDGSYRFCGADGNRSNPLQIRCINICDLAGLTFFCAGRVIYGIHAHQNSLSSAIDTYSSLSPSAQTVALLRYFPLNTGQEIINQVWVRESPPFPERSRTIMICTSHRTEIFGPNGSDPRCRYVQLACGITTSLLYHDPAFGNPISIFGAVSPSPTLQPTPEPPKALNRGYTPSMHCSQASLKDVEHVEIYVHTLEDFRCSGILVKHDDGREEALGQRRFGLPNIQTRSISRPSQMHYNAFRTSNDHLRLYITFSTPDNPRPVDAKEGWRSQVMAGKAMWAFDWRNDQLQFFDAE